MDDFEMIDVSEEEKKKDNFMIGIYISLIILVVLGLLVYFFGYDIVKSYIQV